MILIYILFEAVCITIFGLAGSYFIWLASGKKVPYGEILNKNGYLLGVTGAVIAGILIAVVRTYYL
jgi:hypothetical protein